MAGVTKTAVQFAEELLDSIDRELILSCAQKADELVQSMISAGFQLRKTKFSSFRLCLGMAYRAFDIDFSYALVDASKTREVLEWLYSQPIGRVGSIAPDHGMLFFSLESRVSFFLYNIDQAVALDFEKERSAATADEAQP